MEIRRAYVMEISSWSSEKMEGKIFFILNFFKFQSFFENFKKIEILQKKLNIFQKSKTALPFNTSNIYNHWK